MTAQQLFNQALTQFQVMYLSPEQQAAIKAQALRVCQSKMGPFEEITAPEGTIDTPADFLSVAVAVDAKGRWQEVARVKTPEIPATGGNELVPATDTLQIVGLTPVTPAPLSPVVAALTVGNRNGFYGAGRVANTTAVKPFKITYFIDLTKAAQIPSLVESLLYSYFHVMLEIPNNARARQVANATGAQTELPSDEELKQRKDLIETDMEESQSIIPSAAVF